MFGSKRRLKKVDILDVRREDIKRTQQNKVTYLGCMLDDDDSGESMASRMMNKISGRLNFVLQKTIIFKFGIA